MVLLVVDRQLGLDDLLPERVLVAAQVEVAHQLHRDRRAALQRGAVDDVLDRPRGRSRSGRRRCSCRSAGPRSRPSRSCRFVGISLQPTGRAQLVGLDEAEARAVGGEHLRGAAAEDRVQRAERGRRLRDVEDVADRGDRADDQRGGEHAAADQQESRAARLRLCLRRRCRACRDICGAIEITVPRCDFLPVAPRRSLRSVPDAMNSDTAELAIAGHRERAGRARSARRRAGRARAPRRAGRWRWRAARRPRADGARCATAGGRCGARACSSGRRASGTVLAFGFGPVRSAFNPPGRDARASAGSATCSRRRRRAGTRPGTW